MLPIALIIVVYTSLSFMRLGSVLMPTARPVTGVIETANPLGTANRLSLRRFVCELPPAVVSTRKLDHMHAKDHSKLLTPNKLTI